MKPVCVTFLRESDRPMAERVAAATGGYCAVAAAHAAPGDFAFRDVASYLRQSFQAGTPLVVFLAAGAVVRILAPLLEDKWAEPPVICISADGVSVVPILGGHHGANELARRIAVATGGHAAITTTGDVKFGVALDAPPAGYRLVNVEAAKPVMAALANGTTVQLAGQADWLENSSLPFRKDGVVTLRVTDQHTRPGDLELVYAPSTVVLGLGCERGVDSGEMIGLAEQVLEAGRVYPEALACVASLDLKSDEAAIQATARHFGVPARFFDAPSLEKLTPRLANPSEAVFREVGCHGVAEAAALAAAGMDASLFVPKRKSARATAALARSPMPITELAGRARGLLHVVGLGPGTAVWRSPEATLAVEQSSDIVGYSLYLDLIADLHHGKELHDFPLGSEEIRVRHALELAGTGREVALVCSGDAGIYAMAALVFELLDRGNLSEAARRVAVEVVPGISALQAAAARAGAPLGHDFCAISLSDLLTPWDVIKGRIEAAAAGDFVVAFYNPVSRKRRKQLLFAKETLLRFRSGDTPVALATKLGRPGELLRILRLADLDVDDVDMLTTVLVGSSNSRVLTRGDGTKMMYTPRGYAQKPGAGIERPAHAEALS